MSEIPTGWVVIGKVWGRFDLDGLGLQIEAGRFIERIERVWAVKMFRDEFAAIDFLGKLADLATVINKRSREFRQDISENGLFAQRPANLEQQIDRFVDDPEGPAAKLHQLDPKGLLPDFHIDSGDWTQIRYQMLPVALVADDLISK